MWLERRERLKETANNGNGAGMPLTIASQLWPSPRSEDSESCGNHPEATDSLTGACKTLWTTPDTSRRGTERPETRYGRNKGKAGAASLLTEAEYLWNTPNGMAGGSTSRGGDRINEPLLAGQVAAWPTPNARYHKGTDLESRRGGTSLSHAAQTGEFSHRDQPPTGHPSTKRSGRRLNPAFVCWLMGSPWYWTRAEPISCGAAETASWRSAQRSRLLSLCKTR